MTLYLLRTPEKWRSEERMPDNKDKCYCVVDHANKQREREAKNPNRLKLTRKRYGRWIGAEPGLLRTRDEVNSD